MHFLQKKYSLSPFDLLGHTAPAQAGTLLLVGPFLDYWLTNKRIDAFDYTTPSIVSDVEHSFPFFFIFLVCNSFYPIKKVLSSDFLSPELH